MFGLLDRDIKHIKEAVDSFEKIEEVIIFGSRAVGNHKQWSDIDLAVKGYNITSTIVTRLSYILNEEKPLPYFFDLVNYDSLPDNELKRHIDSHGRVFFKSIKH